MVPPTPRRLPMVRHPSPAPFLPLPWFHVRPVPDLAPLSWFACNATWHPRLVVRQPHQALPLLHPLRPFRLRFRREQGRYALVHTASLPVCDDYTCPFSPVGQLPMKNAAKHPHPLTRQYSYVDDAVVPRSGHIFFPDMSKANTQLKQKILSAQHICRREQGRSPHCLLATRRTVFQNNYSAESTTRVAGPRALPNQQHGQVCAGTTGTGTGASASRPIELNIFQLVSRNREYRVSILTVRCSCLPLLICLPTKSFYTSQPS